jgi:hypothetical protein
MDPRQAFLGGAQVKTEGLLALLFCPVLFSPGCATHQGHDTATVQAGRPQPAAKYRVSDLSEETKQKILALDPKHVTEREVRELLSQAPAPQVINIQGGLLHIQGHMVSFSEFLIGMGYPEASIRNPENGAYSYGYYDDSDRIAGSIAWHYEQEGLRPMIIGHSLGGIQAIRILHRLAGDSTKRLRVWNPLTGSEEDRCEITDPLTGMKRPVVGLQLSFASAAVAGGLARVLPNQWDMNAKLRKIPDSVEEFTGFQKGFDPLGGDFLGYGSANGYYSTGTAVVRNVRLPASSAHLTIPEAKSLLNSQEIKEWIDNYQPTIQASGTTEWSQKFGLKSARILWAAEVWYGIKKHWVLELQRLINARVS